ncbi:MAG: hypothetical protein NT131_05990 [Methanomassiliicoccales archaeon]|nr:hypothetical protein [Methanomassiliicoccales archaeon]
MEHLKKESEKEFSRIETSKSRIINLDSTRKRINSLSIRQNNNFLEALRCIEFGLYKSAHVMAWAGFIDYLEQFMSQDNLKKIKEVKKDLEKYSTIEEIAENIVEFELIEIAFKMKLLTKKEKKTLQGLLSKRNECAHPCDYKPDLNETLGYVSELLNRIETLSKKNKYDVLSNEG